MTTALLDRVSIHGFRGARSVELRPRQLCALVGEASSGKSTVLTAIWMLLDAAAPVPTADDVSHGDERVLIDGAAGEQTFFLDARPPATLNLNRNGAPPTLFLPAVLRGSTLAAPASTEEAAGAGELLRPTPAAPFVPWASENGGAAIVDGFERLCEAGLSGLVVLVEEPELYLSPQAQRYLYRLLRRFAEAGNQVLYTTHAATLLSVAHLEELALVRYAELSGTTLCQPDALPRDASFRAAAGFDAERSEVFLARAALLVEGMTEKLAFPFVFDALGYDADREAVAVIECGGKANIPLFARICAECGIPFVVVHDRDAPRGQQPNESERITNAAIAEVAGRARTVTLVPDFEGLMGLNSRNRKPRRAFARLRDGSPVPKPLVDAVERVVDAARGEIEEQTVRPSPARAPRALPRANRVRQGARKTPPRRP